MLVFDMRNRCLNICRNSVVMLWATSGDMNSDSRHTISYVMLISSSVGYCLRLKAAVAIV